MRRCCHEVLRRGCQMLDTQYKGGFLFTTRPVFRETEWLERNKNNKLKRKGITHDALMQDEFQTCQKLVCCSCHTYCRGTGKIDRWREGVAGMECMVGY